MDRILFSMCAVSRRMIFCSSSMLLAPGTFPKLRTIPFLISPSAPTITGTCSLCPHSPQPRGFNLQIFVFWELFNDNGTISLQHRLAWSLITISGLFVNSSLPVCICIPLRIMTSSFSVTVSGLCSYNLSGTLILQCWHAFQWIYAAALLCLSR